MVQATHRRGVGLNLAGQAAQSTSALIHANEMLARWEPRPGQPDRRGWKWYLLRGLGAQARQMIPASADPIRSVAWSRDGNLLASGGDDKIVYVWEASTGRPRTTLRGHTSDVRSVSWAPHGHRLASGADDHTV